MGQSRQREETVGTGYALYVGNLPLHTAWGDMWKPVSSKAFCATSEIHLEMGLDCPVGPAQILFMNG